MGAFLSQPLQSKVLQRKGNKHFRVGAAVMQGWREGMEDAHSIHLELENHRNTSFFAIFDGHCGKEASKFCSQNFHKYIDSINGDLSETLVTSKIVELDNNFMEKYPIDDGTTAVFALINPTNNEYNITVGNIGDSRAALYKDGIGIALSEDHKPNTPTEQRRIEAAGGYVSMNRVRGNLALSRAIGDRSYKVPSEFEHDKKEVICCPEYKSSIAVANDFLLIGCDGIYEGDIFTFESAIKWVSEKLKETDDLAKITAELLDECLSRGSRDNMSAMIIQLKDGSSYEQPDEYIPGPYYEGPRHSEFQKAYKQFCENHGVSLEQSFEQIGRAHV